MERTECGREYKVRDVSQADFGRLEIKLAETEMPGLTACRTEFGADQPLKGVNITGALHMTVQTAVLIETLTALGAQVRWCCGNRFSTQDHAAAAIARDTATVFAWKEETVEEFWWCIDRALDWGLEVGGPNLIMDQEGYVSWLIHAGFQAEEEYAANKGVVPQLDFPEEISQEFKVGLTMIYNGLEANPNKYHTIAKNLYGISEATTSGVTSLYKMQASKVLLCPGININDSVTKGKFDNLYGCRHSFPDGLMRATDVMIAGKVGVVCGYGDVGKACAAALKSAGARVIVTEIDPICALQALMEGFQVLTLDNTVSDGDIFVTTTGNKDVITVDHMRKMKDNAIVCNMGFDQDIDMSGLKGYPGVKRVTIKPQTDMWVFPGRETGVIVLAEGQLVNLSCATGHPSFAMSCTFTNQVLAHLDLWKERESGKYVKEVYVLPKELDEKVATLHLAKLGAQLTKLTEPQSNYLGVPLDGPFKPPFYKY